jgi:predicted enzyme related to lactoylglutathione lyase
MADEFGGLRQSNEAVLQPLALDPVVHLELHTGNLARASDSQWLPYVEVADLMEMIERARALGAAVVLEPREGPVGWRSILAVPSGARIAFWQSKL